MGICGRAGMRFRGRGTWADEVDALQRREAISRTRKHVWASERHRAEPSAAGSSECPRALRRAQVMRNVRGAGGREGGTRAAAAVVWYVCAYVCVGVCVCVCVV